MRDTIYIYSQMSLFNLIKEILSVEYRVSPLTLDDMNSGGFTNNNTLLVLNKNFTNEIKEFFFLYNNAVIFLPKGQHLVNLTKSHNTNIFYGHTTVKKFIDEIKTCFIAKTFFLKNIEILGEKIINNKTGLSELLTPLEKKILIVLFENKKIKRNYFLEEILKININTETKTIESHLTRIRRKLLKIKCDIQVTSKEDVFYIEV